MDDNNDIKEQEDNEVIDAEIIDDAGKDISDENTGEADQSTAFLNLEELIKNHIDSIAKLREELKKQREMYEDSFNNDPVYREHSEKVKEANKAKSSIKKQIGSQPSVALLAQKIKDLRFDINESSQTLSELLKDYSEQTGATQIETKSGQVMEIVSTVKLVKVSSK